MNDAAERATPGGRLSFSLRAMFLVIAWVGLACASLVKPSQVWASVTGFVSLLLLCFAVLGTVYIRGEWRAFWCGFAILGWGHLFLWELMNHTTFNLPTAHLTSQVNELLFPSFAPMSGAQAQALVEHRTSFAVAAWWHSSLLLGILGGITARWLCVRNSPPDRMDSADPRMNR